MQVVIPLCTAKGLREIISEPVYMIYHSDRNRVPYCRHYDLYMYGVEIPSPPKSAKLLILKEI
jgi:hypothetical protein